MIFKGKNAILEKRLVEGNALVTEQPINYIASYSKNLAFSWKKGKISDKGHELFKQDLRDKILFVPCSIGSTTGGLFLLEAINVQITPKAIVVKKADSLTVSGGVLASVWVEDVPLPPILECPEIFDHIKTGDLIQIIEDQIEILPFK